MLLSQQILLRQNDLQNEIRFQIRDCLNAFEKTHVARTRQAVAKAAL
jgi:hypothetical protein